jgi:hypothetical protein
MTYSHRKHRNNDDANPELRNECSLSENEKKTNLRPRHVVIGNTRKGLSSEDAIENVEARQTDEVENSGENNTVISEGRRIREPEANWVNDDEPKAIARYNHLPHSSSWTPRISGQISS